MTRTRKIRYCKKRRKKRKQKGGFHVQFPKVCFSKLKDCHSKTIGDCYSQCLRTLIKEVTEGTERGNEIYKNDRVGGNMYIDEWGPQKGNGRFPKIKYADILNWDTLQKKLIKLYNHITPGYAKILIINKYTQQKKKETYHTWHAVIVAVDDNHNLYLIDPKWRTFSINKDILYHPWLDRKYRDNKKHSFYDSSNWADSAFFENHALKLVTIDNSNNLNDKYNIPFGENSYKRQKYIKKKLLSGSPYIKGLPLSSKLWTSRLKIGVGQILGDGRRGRKAKISKKDRTVKLGGRRKRKRRKTRRR